MITALDELGKDTRLGDLTPLHVLDEFVSDRVMRTMSGVEPSRRPPHLGDLVRAVADRALRELSCAESMDHPISPAVKAEIERRDQLAQRDATRAEARRAIALCYEYLRPNWIFGDEDHRWAAIKERAQAGDPDAIRELVPVWIEKTWKPAKRMMKPFASAERVRGWSPPSSELWIDLHPIFVQFFGASGSKKLVSTTSTAVSELWIALGQHGGQLWRYFSWLETMLDASAVTTPRESQPNATVPLHGAAGGASQTIAPGAPLSPTVAEGKFVHAPDFCWLVVGDVKYAFSKGQQAGVIRVLFEEWQRAGRRDGCGLGEETIGEKLKATTSRFRVQKIFNGHPAKGTILRSSQRGTWALYLNAP